MAAEPFRIEVPQASLDELNDRLLNTRWPSQANAPPWAYGTDLSFMQALTRRWVQGFNWRRWEEKLNAIPNFQVEIDGRRLHFMMEKGSGKSPLPLLLLHGWPGSIVEFLEVIDPLAHPERHGGNPDDGFTVVIPSLPGFGFSQAPGSPLLPSEISATFSVLVRQVLGFDHYVVQGGDWGAIIASWMALDHPEGMRALHLNGPGLAGGHARPEPVSAPLTPEETSWLAADTLRRQGYSAYQQLQGTEPQTLAYGLTDSPVGLAAWIVQRFHAWTVRGSEDAPPFEMDHLLANVMLYWLAGINAPNWLYVSLVNGTARSLENGRRIDVPVGFLLCPDDNTLPAPMSWLSRAFSSIARRRVATKGGHFLAFEQPEVFVAEMRDFFAPYR